MSIKSVIISFFVICLLGGCFAAKKIQPNIQSQVASNGLVNTANNIQAENQTIKTTAQDISKSTHEPSTAAKAGVIITSTGRIDNASKSLIASSKEINKIAAEYEKNCTELKAKINKLETEKKSAINKIFTMFYALSALSIVGSIVLFFAGKGKIAVTMGGAAIALLVLTHILQAYWLWFVWGGVVLIVLVVVYSLWDLLRNHKSLVELIGFVDNEIKPALTTEAKQKIFGKNDEPVADKTQSNALKATVKKIRGKN